MTIRTYQSTDRGECIEIFKSNMPLFFAPAELLDFENWLNAKDDERLAYKTNQAEHFYVTVEHDKVIACGGFYVPIGEQRANMVWGMVENSQHKKGTGRNLLEFRIQTINEIYPNFIISLDTTQHSYKFFEKLGFTVTKVTKDFYAAGMHRYDMLNK